MVRWVKERKHDAEAIWSLVKIGLVAADGHHNTNRMSAARSVPHLHSELMRQLLKDEVSGGFWVQLM